MTQYKFIKTGQGAQPRPARNYSNMSNTASFRCSGERLYLLNAMTMRKTSSASVGYVLENLHRALVQKAIYYDIVAIVCADLRGVFLSPEHEIGYGHDDHPFFVYWMRRALGGPRHRTGGPQISHKMQHKYCAE